MSRLRFIFSHSALREGWDSPNVFQICTLNETHSVMKKRPGDRAGLRLPVNQDGERVFDENVNKLLVVANESYEDFAQKLQTEYEEGLRCDVWQSAGSLPLQNWTRFVAEEEKPLGRKVSEQIFNTCRERHS
jgi:type III restriction enzyme